MATASWPRQPLGPARPRTHSISAILGLAIQVWSSSRSCPRRCVEDSTESRCVKDSDAHRGVKCVEIGQKQDERPLPDMPLALAHRAGPGKGSWETELNRHEPEAAA